MATRSTHIARRWFAIIGLLVGLFVIAMVVSMWPGNGPMSAVSGDTNGEANAEASAAADDDVNAEANADVDADVGDDNDENGDAEVLGDGWFTTSQASAGADGYAQHCAQCHGEELEGGVGPPLAGDEFWDRWSGESVHAFFEVTRQTMPQGDPGSLSATAYADITAHVLQTNDFPPGDSDLPPEPDRLQALTIERAATETGAEAGSADEESAPPSEPDEPVSDEADSEESDVEAEGVGRDGDDADADADADAAVGDGEGWFTGEQAERGEDAYRQHCAECHGEDLQGDPPLVGDGFLGGYETVGALFDYTREQMPQGDEGSLEDDVYADVIAFILAANEFPSGDEELDGDDREAMDDMPLDADQVDGEPGDAEADANGEAETDTDTNGENDTNGEAEDADVEDAEGDAASGDEVYAAHCASCHQPEGQGQGTFPALADNEFVHGDERELVELALHGRAAMPAFASTLDDAEIAAVLTHVRSAWGNDAGAIDADLVADVRGDMDEPEPVEVDLPDAWFELGETAYVRYCAVCHQVSGVGIPGAFPALAENAFVQGDVDELLRVLLHGRAGMPAFAGSLDNTTIALIASHVRNAWENEAHLVDAEMVEVVRGGGDLALDPTTPTFRPGAGD